MTTIRPFRVLCHRCGTVAESWYRHGPAPDGATLGPATCTCGAVTADSMGPPGAGRIVTEAPQDQWEVLDEPETLDTPENRTRAEQELPALAAELGRRIWISDHGIYLVGPRRTDDEELVANSVIGAWIKLRWLVEMQARRRTLAAQMTRPRPPYGPS